MDNLNNQVETTENILIEINESRSLLVYKGKATQVRVMKEIYEQLYRGDKVYFLMIDNVNAETISKISENADELKKYLNSWVYSKVDELNNMNEEREKSDTFSKDSQLRLKELSEQITKIKILLKMQKDNSEA